jgi:hypothetical protein
MRTTLTLDEDVAAKLTTIARRSGLAFRRVVNDTLRRGLAQPVAPRSRPPFRVEARDLGALRPGLSLDNVSELLERAEGPLHR